MTGGNGSDGVGADGPALGHLLLVRHGESTWNAEGRLQGQADPSLSALGRRQAAALAPWVDAWAPSVVATSDLRRASETASLLGFDDARIDPRWRELDVGLWTGQAAAAVREEHGEAYRAWREGREAPPEGEPLADFAARVEQAGRELLAPRRVALAVAHGGPIRTLCATLLGASVGGFAAVLNGSLTVVELGPAGPRLAAYNLTPTP